MTNHVYKGDLPKDLDLGQIVAIECETMGLNPKRDRVCVVQLSSGDGHAHLVQVAKGQTSAPNLCRMLEDPNVLKLFHFGTHCKLTGKYRIDCRNDFLRINTRSYKRESIFKTAFGSFLPSCELLNYMVCSGLTFSCLPRNHFLQCCGVLK